MASNVVTPGPWELSPDTRASIPVSARRACETLPMSEPRAKDREAAVLLRMSVENKARLVAEAQDKGVSVQVLLERRVFDPDAEVRKPGRTPKTRDPELFRMTG